LLLTIASIKRNPAPIASRSSWLRLIHIEGATDKCNMLHAWCRHGTVPSTPDLQPVRRSTRSTCYDSPGTLRCPPALWSRFCSARWASTIWGSVCVSAAPLCVHQQ